MQVLYTWSFSPFSQALLLTGCCMGPRRDSHHVYRPWYFPQLLPIEGAHGTVGRFLAFVSYFLGDSFFLGGSLVLPQLSILISFYDMHGLLLHAFCNE